MQCQITYFLISYMSPLKTIQFNGMAVDALEHGSVSENQI